MFTSAHKITLGLAIVILLSVASPLAAEEFIGTIESVAVSSLTLSVDVQGADSPQQPKTRELTFQVEPAAIITLDDQIVTLQELQRGEPCEVMARQNENGEWVASLITALSGYVLAPEQFSGILKSVGTGTLTLTAPDSNANAPPTKDLIFQVPQAAPITLDGQPAELTDLKAGQTCLITAEESDEGDLVATRIAARSDE